MKDLFNRLGTKSDTDTKLFVLLRSGVVLQYYEKVELHNNYIKFNKGRIITAALPDGLAFETVEVYKDDIVGNGTLLKPIEDNGVFDEENK